MPHLLTAACGTERREPIRCYVRSTSVSGNSLGSQAFPGGAMTGREQVQQKETYSITSSAATSSLSGTVRPSILAVWALMTSSILLDCRTGKSVGLAPLRMRPV